MDCEKTERERRNKRVKNTKEKEFAWGQHETIRQTDKNYVKSKRGKPVRQLGRDMKEQNLYDNLEPLISQTRDDLLKMEREYTLEVKYIRLAEREPKVLNLETAMAHIYDAVIDSRCHISRANKLPPNWKIHWTSMYISHGTAYHYNSMLRNTIKHTDYDGSQHSTNIIGKPDITTPVERARYLAMKIYASRYAIGEKKRVKTATWIQSCLECFSYLPGINPRIDANGLIDTNAITGQSSMRDKTYSDMTEAKSSNSSKVQFGDWDKDEVPKPSLAKTTGLTALGGSIHSFVDWMRTRNKGPSIITTCKETILRVRDYVKNALVKYFLDTGLEVAALIIVTIVILGVASTAMFTIFRKIFTSIFRKEEVTMEDFKEIEGQADTIDRASEIFQKVAECITYSIDRAANFDTAGYLAKFGKIATNYNSIERCLSSVWGHVKPITEWAFTKVTGKPLFDTTLITQEVVKRTSLLNEKRQVFNGSKRLSMEDAKEVVDASDFLRSKIAEKLHVVLPSLASSVTSNLLSNTDLVDYANELVHGAKFRPMPTWIHLVGNAGEGKTRLMNNLIKWTKFMVKPHDDNPVDRYDRKSCNEYWEGYTHQFCMVVDDLLQADDPESRRLAALEMIYAVNNNPYHLHYAAIGDKKGQYFDSPFVFTTSNYKDSSYLPDNLGITDYNAFYRRMAIKVMIKRDKKQPDRMDAYEDAKAKFTFTEILSSGALGKTYRLDRLLSNIYSAHIKNVTEFTSDGPLNDEQMITLVKAFKGQGDNDYVKQAPLKATSPPFNTTMTASTTTTTTQSTTTTLTTTTTTTTPQLVPVYNVPKVKTWETPKGQAESDDEEEVEVIVENASDDDDNKPDNSSNSSAIVVDEEPLFYEAPSKGKSIEKTQVHSDELVSMLRAEVTQGQDDPPESPQARINMAIVNYRKLSAAKKKPDLTEAEKDAISIKQQNCMDIFYRTFVQTYRHRDYDPNDPDFWNESYMMRMFKENPADYIANCETPVYTLYKTMTVDGWKGKHKAAEKMIIAMCNESNDDNERYIQNTTTSPSDIVVPAEYYDHARYISSWTTMDCTDIHNLFMYAQSPRMVVDSINKIQNHRVKFALYIDQKIRGNYKDTQNIKALNVLCVMYDVRIRIIRNSAMNMETEIFFSSCNSWNQEIIPPHWLDQVYNQWIDGMVKGVQVQRDTMTQIKWKRNSLWTALKNGSLASYDYKTTSTTNFVGFQERNYLHEKGYFVPEKCLNDYTDYSGRAFRLIALGGFCVATTGVLIMASHLITTFFFADGTMLGQSFDKNTEKKAKKNLVKKRPGMKKIPTTKGAPVKTQHFNVVPKGQSASSQMLGVRFAKNTEYITCKTETGDQTRMFGFFVGGNTFVTAAHAFRALKVSRIIVHWGNVENSAEIELILGHDYEVKYLGSRDAVKIIIKKDRLPQYKDIRKHLMTREEFSKLKDMSSVCRVSFAEDGTLQTFCVNRATPAVGASTIKFKGQDFVSTDLWMVRDMPGISGDCGYPYFTLNEKFERKLLGIHTAATVSASYFTPLFRDDFEEDKEGQGCEVKSKFIYATPQLEQITLEPEFKIMIPGCKTEATIYLDKGGEKRIMAAYEPGESVLRETDVGKPFQFRDELVKPPFECIKRPRMLKRYMKEVDGMKVMVNPEQNAFDKFKGRNAPGVVFNPSNSKYWKGVFHSLFNLEKVRLATREEALNGIKGSEFCGPIDCSTSSSVAFSEFGITSETLFPRNFETGLREFSPAMTQILDAREKGCYAKNRVPPYLCHGTKKDELGMPQKVDIPRIFCNGAKAPLIEARMVFMTFFEQVISHEGEGDVYIGINPHGTHWRNLWRKLKSKSVLKLIADDIKAWDLHMRLWFIEGFEKEALKQGLDTELVRRMVLILRSTLTPYVIIKGRIVRYIGMPSGSYITAVVNSMYNSWMTRICWDMKHPDKNFDDYLAQATFGDDLIQAVLDALGEDEWNGQILAEMRKKLFAIETTSIFKDGRPVPKFMPLEVEEWKDGAASFIKREFRVLNGEVYPILDIESINAMVCWVRPDKNRSIELCTKENIETALRELVYHGEEIYTKYYIYFQKYFHKKGWGVIQIDYESELAKYITH